MGCEQEPAAPRAEPGQLHPAQCLTRRSVRRDIQKRSKLACSLRSSPRLILPSNSVPAMGAAGRQLRLSMQRLYACTPSGVRQAPAAEGQGMRAPRDPHLCMRRCRTAGPTGPPRSRTPAETRSGCQTASAHPVSGVGDCGEGPHLSRLLRTPRGVPAACTALYPPSLPLICSRPGPSSPWRRARV